MRGHDGQTGSMFSYVDLEERISAGHRLRKIQEFVNAALAALDAAFATLYSADGRPSIAPERLLRAALIQACPRLRACEKIEARCLPVCFTRPGANRAVTRGGDGGQGADYRGGSVAIVLGLG